MDQDNGPQNLLNQLEIQAKRKSDALPDDKREIYNERLKFWSFYSSSLLNAAREGSISDEQFAEALGSLLAIQQIENLTDNLTQLWNRQGLESFAANIFQHCEEGNEDFVLAVVDIDHFKNFNTVFGHGTGDLVLAELAKLMKDDFRKEDIIGRWGGEEFVVLLPTLNKFEGFEETGEKLTVEEKGRRGLERFRKNTEEKLAERITSAKITNPITVSVGFTQFTKGDNLESMFKRADSALYVAKGEWESESAPTGARNRVVAYKPDFPEIKK